MAYKNSVEKPLEFGPPRAGPGVNIEPKVKTLYEKSLPVGRHNWVFGVYETEGYAGSSVKLVRQGQNKDAFLWFGPNELQDVIDGLVDVEAYLNASPIAGAPAVRRKMEEIRLGVDQEIIRLEAENNDLKAKLDECLDIIRRDLSRAEDAAIEEGSRAKGLRDFMARVSPPKKVT